MKVIPLAFALALAAAVGCAKAPVADQTGGGNESGGTGNGGTSGALSCTPADPPTPPGGGANFPFPQHTVTANCFYPTSCNDVDASSAWTTYKAAFVVSGGGSTLRVQRPENGNDTVSEGIGYGMLMAVFMNDKPTFDGLWAFATARPDDKGLMNWHIGSNGAVASGGTGAATDADEDMAFALVMADKQWGGYSTPAHDILNKILANEIDSGTGYLKPDDHGTTDVNPSYLAPAYYRVFAGYTGNSAWTNAVNGSYTLLQNCAATHTGGLVPDWCTRAGAVARGSHYSYDATRTPWRIALDACWNNEQRAKNWLTQVAGFFSNIGVTSIKDGYNLDGTAAGTYNAMVFFATAGAAGMAAGLQGLVNDTYTRAAALSRNGSSNNNYYNASWGVLSVLFMNGNFVSLGAQ
jgi:endo-1,4-beta-D-glucanase Y